MATQLRRAGVAAFVLWSWIPVVVMAFLLAHPGIPAIGGDAIYVIDRVGPYDSRVSEAHRSDFRAGDRFSAASLSLAGRLLLYAYSAAQPTDRLSLQVLRDGVRRNIIVRPTPINAFAAMGPLDIALWIAQTLLNALVMTAAGLLALIRPGVVTGSLMFALFGGLIELVFPTPLPLPGLAMFFIGTLGYGFAAYCSWESVRFASRFPDGKVGTHAGPLLVAGAAIALLLGSWDMLRNSAGVLYPIDAVSHALISDDLGSLGRTLAITANVVLVLLAVAAIVLRYRASPNDARLKLRALLLAYAVVLLYSAGSWLKFLLVPFHRETTPLDEVVSWSGLVVYLVPVTIFAAILRHRLFGLRFVIDRALVYGGLALIIVAPLRLVNIVLATRFPHTRVAAFAEIVVAVVLALSLDRLRALVESLLRHTIFRGRERTLDAIAELTREADDVADRESLQRLVRQAGDALALTAAALVDDEAEPRNMVPDGDPALVVALHVGRLTVGRLVFGAHRNGADLDTEEVQALKRFGAVAERASERLTVEQLQIELAVLRGQARQSAELDTTAGRIVM